MPNLWEHTHWGWFLYYNFLHEFILINEHRSKEVAFAGDLTVAGKIEKIM